MPALRIHDFLIRLTALATVWGLIASVARAQLDSSSASPASFSDQSLEFFEKEVRPLLVKRCYECHSAQARELKGGLRLDSRALALKGGDTSPAIVPGKPNQSLLIDAINYGELYQMPPKSKLPESEIAALTRWVELGAPWTESKIDAHHTYAEKFDLKARKQAHWAWQPVRNPPVPSVRDRAWPRCDIDRFILAKLEGKGLAPADVADKPALIRRAYFDLVGLPPPAEALDRFLADESPQAFERVVDELLASPRFGERWARHWLDLVRYAETYGHEFDYPIEHAWQYRDYVIRALNADVPYDQFAIEHIAGDLLPEPRLHPTDRFNESIIGTGFWWFGEQVHAPVDVLKHEADRVDNQIDVLGKTFLGLTLGCARCHDHKFDAISTADVYSLWGFAKSTRLQTAYLDPGGKIAVAARQIEAIESSIGGDRRSDTSAPNALHDDDAVGNALSGDDAVGNALRGVPAAKLPNSSATTLFADFNGGDLQNWLVTGEAFGDRPTRAGDWTSHNGKAQRLPPGCAHSGRFSNRFTGALRSKNFTLDKPRIAYHIAGKNAQVRLIIQGYRMDTFNALLFSDCAFKVNNEQFEWRIQAGDLHNHLGKRAYIEILDEGDGWVALDEIRFVDDDWKPPNETLAQKAFQDIEPSLHSDKVAASATKIEAIVKNLPRPMPVLAAADGEGVDDRVHIRGNPKTLGDLVPRRFLTAIAGDSQPAIPSGAGSGRLELARQIVVRDNPLFARVIVNRIWQHLFGRGIVATVDNFGVLGERPSHPELLDYLATRFIEDRYSIKRMIRTIMLSKSYRMASRASGSADDDDPNNVLVHRQNLKRLEGEAIRDAILAVSGRLDLTMYGPPVKIHLTPFMTGRGRPNDSGPLDGDGRRSIYLEVRRNFLPPMMLAFDTPLPASTVGRRNVSNVPAQALILMNDRFVAEQARRWAEKTLDRSGFAVRGSAEQHAAPVDLVAARVERIHREAFARRPSENERKSAIDFLRTQAAEYGESPWETSRAAWADLCHILINAKEFVFVE